MFSRRSFVPATENELSALQRAARRPYVDLGAGNPTLVGLDRPNFAAVLGRHEAAYEPDPRGWRPARAALAELYAREGRGHLGEEDFILGASTSEAYAHLLMALCDPGDAVAIPEPSYPLFEHLARLSGVRVQRYRLAHDGVWHIDFDSLRRATDARTRAIFVVSPNNPTGSVLRTAELHELWRLGLPLVVDEVFRTYLWPGADRIVAEPLSDPPVLTFLLDGLSKRLGAPELKLGWTVLAGPGKEDAARRLEWISDMFLSASGPVQRALPELLDEGSSFQKTLHARVLQNLECLREAARGSAVTPLFGEGGWYVPLRLPALVDEQTWLKRLLEQERVLPQPGWLFDFEQEPVFVLGLLLPEDVWAAAVSRLVAHVRAACERGP